MSPEFLLSLLTELGGYEGMTKVWIVMNEQGGGHQDIPDGRRVFTKTETHYIWKREDAKKLWDFTQWKYVEHLRIDWSDEKSLSVNHCFTEIDLYGFNELPNIKALPGEGPRKIVLNF